VARSAWPAANTSEHDGWLLLESGGYTRRANSVQALKAGSLPLDEKIQHCETFYRWRGGRAVFKLTEATQPPELDAELEARGYVKSTPTSVQIRNLDIDLPDCDISEVRLESGPTLQWVEACASLWGIEGARTNSFKGIIRRIAADFEPSFFASVTELGAIRTVGLGVVRDETLYLAELITAKAAQERGYARRAIVSLMAKGREHGLSRALLQVVADNEPALGLYRQLEFEEAYRYWYREAPLG
jgi:ribosomal protein S18 acetylase RimI-like enzyme